MPKKRQAYKRFQLLGNHLHPCRTGILWQHSCPKRLLRKFVTAYPPVSPFGKVVLGSGGKNQEESVLGNLLPDPFLTQNHGLASRPGCYYLLPIHGLPTKGLSRIMGSYPLLASSWFQIQLWKWKQQEPFTNSLCLCRVAEELLSSHLGRSLTLTAHQTCAGILAPCSHSQGPITEEQDSWSFLT